MSLEDILPGYEVVFIDDKEYKIEYDFRAIAYFEKKTDMTIYQAKELILDNKMKLSDQVVLFHAGLLRHQPKFELEALTNRKDIALLLTDISDNVMNAFLRPLLPPEIFEKIKQDTKEEAEKKK